MLGSYSNPPIPANSGLALTLRWFNIVLETAPENATVSSLSHDPKRITTPEDATLPRADQDRSLESAIDDFRRVSPTNGEVDGDEDQADYADYFRSIEAEARRLGVFYDGLQPAIEGGREHDLIFDEATNTVLKFTKPAKAAYVVTFEFGSPRLVPGLPVQYLERQALHNELFADNIRFVGVGGDASLRRIITRQNRITGREARWDEITRFMTEELGFTKLRHNYGIGYEDSYGFVRGDVAVFDLRPANVVISESGIFDVIDSIPVRLNEDSRGAFVP
jgi:hypothetical protein